MYRKSELLEAIKTKYNIHKNRKITFEEVKEISRTEKIEMIYYIY